MQKYFLKTNTSLYHDFIFLNVQFQVAVACSSSLESGVQREDREQGKRGGGEREGEGERWEYPNLPQPLAVFPTAISLCRRRSGTL